MQWLRARNLVFLLIHLTSASGLLWGGNKFVLCTMRRSSALSAPRARLAVPGIATDVALGVLGATTGGSNGLRANAPPSAGWWKGSRPFCQFCQFVPEGFPRNI